MIVQLRAHERSPLAERQPQSVRVLASHVMCQPSTLLVPGHAFGLCLRISVEAFHGSHPLHCEVEAESLSRCEHLLQIAQIGENSRLHATESGQPHASLVGLSGQPCQIRVGRMP